MNPETLRKAVELADGWGLSDSELVLWPDTPGRYFDWPNIYLCYAAECQPMIDALAAQLVRQVHAISPTIASVYVDPDSTTVYTRDDGGFKHEFESSQAENTINAIVASEVLENDH